VALVPSVIALSPCVCQCDNKALVSNLKLHSERRVIIQGRDIERYKHSTGGYIAHVSPIYARDHPV